MSTAEQQPASSRVTPPRQGAPAWAQRLSHALSYRTIGVVYVWVAFTAVFSVWLPEVFPTVATVRQVLDGNAVVALLALSLVIPLSTRTFDLSIAYIATLSGVAAAYFIAHGVSIAGAIGIAMAMSLAAGTANACVVVILGVDSFIATLATGSLILAFVTMITHEIAITSPRLAGGFADIAQTTVGGVTLPVFYALGVAVAIWFVLEHTATGRRLYATGFNLDSARLAGVRTSALRFGALAVSGAISGIAGIVLVSTIGSGDPAAGGTYLLPAFAAAFLGATQFRAGRFNAWGTLTAVLMLGTGATGLGLAAAPSWAPDMFQGVALIAALAVTGRQRRRLRSGWRQRLGRRSRPGVDRTSSPDDQQAGNPLTKSA